MSIPGLEPSSQVHEYFKSKDRKDKPLVVGRSDTSLISERFQPPKKGSAGAFDRVLHDELQSLRTIYKLDDRLEPADVLKRFREINRAIDDICFHISSKSSDMKFESSMIYWSLRSIISRQLCTLVFDRFHPMMEFECSELFRKMYSSVQSRESQRIAGKWRSNSFMAYDETKELTIGQWKTATAKKMQSEWDSMLGNGDPDMSRVESLLEEAYNWCRDTRTRATSFDFSPVISNDANFATNLGTTSIVEVNFNPSIMTPTGSNGNSEKCFAVGIGLRSSRLLDKQPEWFWLEKMQVVESSVLTPCQPS